MASDKPELVVHRPGRRRVVIAFAAKQVAISKLTELIGDDAQLVDIRDADGTEEMVLAPSASPQLLGKLKHAFPDSALLVVEVDDPQYGLRFGGPVKRALDAGADAYVVADGIDQLAALIDGTAPANHTISADEPAALEAVDASLDALLDAIIESRSKQRDLA